MLNNKDTLLQAMNRLGLSRDESKVYLALLDTPASHLELARVTGVNRSKVYRIADTLISRGLITSEQDDTGRRLAANDPRNLEIALVTAEEKLKGQRSAFGQAIPMLESIFSQMGQDKPTNFVVNTYEGVDGFKQMLWNELKTKGELLVFGFGGIEDLVDNRRWAEKHRVETLEAGYKIREVVNPKSKPVNFTKNEEFVKNAYQRRNINPSIIELKQQIVIYNNTVNIYNWQDGKRVGVEIINPAFAATQRAIFEHYWQLATPPA